MKNDLPLALFEKGGNSVWHHPLMAYLEEEEILQRYLTEKFPRVQDVFLELYPQWINESKLNSVTGLTSVEAHIRPGALVQTTLTSRPSVGSVMSP